MTRDATPDLPEPAVATRELAMFPLGSVLLPGMPLSLRVFEPRYLALLEAVFAQEVPEFGVVLIERGSEVGGGDARFAAGTVARITAVDRGDGAIGVLAAGTDRFEVVRWLQDSPFPRAEVRPLPALVTDSETPEALAAAEAVVRATLARVSEFVNGTWSAEVELSPLVEQRIWQVAGIAPLSPLDHYALLRATSARGLLSRLVEDTQGAELLYTADWDARGEPGETSP